jgi:hypothetical protein
MWKTMKKYSNILLKRFLPVLAGAVVGYMYYYYIGCNNGHCPISSDPLISTVYGGVIGLLIAIPAKSKKKEDEG